MADNANLTAGDGSVIAGTEKIGGVDYPRIIVGWGPAGTVNKTDVATGKPLPVQIRTATGLIPIGEPTDAANTATDATSVSGISIQKQISKSVQLGATAAKQPALGTAGTASTDVITVQGIVSGTNLNVAVAAGGPAQYIEDVAAAVDPIGQAMIGVRRDTLSVTEVSADGDNIAIKATNKGELHTRNLALEAALIAGTTHVIVDSGGGGGTQYTEDAASAADPVGTVPIYVRRDTPSATEVSAEGDNIAAHGSKYGAAYVTAVDKNGTAADFTTATAVSLAAGAAAIAKAEDVASSDADVGVPAMAVRKATPANTSGTDGDYEMLQMSAGKLWVQHLGNFVTVTTQVTRPADTNAYTANDCMSDSTSAPTSGGYTFTSTGRISGGSGIITDAVIGMSTAPGTSLQGELWIFDASVTNVNDNAAFSISDADRDKLVGIIPFTTSSSGALNASACVSGLNIGFTCISSANLRFLIKVINAYTPASAEVFTARLKILQID